MRERRFVQAAADGATGCVWCTGERDVLRCGECRTHLAGEARRQGEGEVEEVQARVCREARQVREAEGKRVSWAVQEEGEVIMVKRLLPFLLGLCVPLTFTGPAMASFGVNAFSVSAENQNGSPDVQAGSHPYALTTSFTLKENPWPEALENSPKDIQVELPPGFFGDPQATPRCTYAKFHARSCPPGSRVGFEKTYVVTREGVALGKSGSENPSSYPTEPVYNIEPSPGVAAEFAYYVLGEIAPIILDVSVRTGGDYGLTVKVPNITAVYPIEGTTVTLWGVPCAVNESGCLPAPLLTNPTSCGVPRTATFSTDSWEDPGKYVSLSSPMPEIEGCEKLDFSPSIKV